MKKKQKKIKRNQTSGAPGSEAPDGGKLYINCTKLDASRKEEEARGGKRRCSRKGVSEKKKDTVDLVRLKWAESSPTVRKRARKVIKSFKGSVQKEKGLGRKDRTVQKKSQGGREPRGLHSGKGRGARPNFCKGEKRRKDCASKLLERSPTFH